MRQEFERREVGEAPEPVEADRAAPVSDDLMLASAVGNRAMAAAVAARRPSTAPRTLARDGPDVPPAPVTLNAPAEREKDAFPEADKERARKTVIGPLRAGAEQLAAGPKANIGSVLRHLRPVRAAIIGVKWQPPELLAQALEAIADLEPDMLALESLKLSDRQAITKSRSHWATAKRELAKASAEIRKASGPDKKHPDREFREGSVQDIAAITALSGQVDATVKDLAEAPRTQDGYMAVEKGAGDVAGQFETIEPPDDGGFVKGAKKEFEDGIAILAPLALGKEQAIKSVQGNLSAMADSIGTLVGDEPAETPKEDDDADPTATPAPLPPAPPGPNPLPPPPPPPGNAPDPAATH